MEVQAQPSPILLGQSLTNPVPLVFSGPFDAITGEPAQRLGSSTYGSLEAALIEAVLRPGEFRVRAAGVQLPASALLGPARALTGPALENLVRRELADLLGAIGSELEPALAALGIQLGYADFRVYSVTDAQPMLFLR